MKNFIALDSEKVTDLWMALNAANRDSINFVRRYGNKMSKEQLDEEARIQKLTKELAEFLKPLNAIIIEEAE